MVQSKFVSGWWVLGVGFWCLFAPGELPADDSRWHVEVTLADTDLDATFGRQWPKSFDDSDDAVSFAVGYSLGRHFDLQVGYHDLGSYTGTGSPCPENSDACIAFIQERLVSSGLVLCAEPGCEALVAVPLTAEISGYSISLLPRYPLGERFSIFGRVGLMSWDSDVFGAFGLGRIDTFSGEDLLAGVGAKYTFPHGFGVLAEYRWLDLDATSASLGASLQF